MSVSKRQASPFLTLTLLTVVVVAALSTVTTLWKQDVIEVDLLQRTRQALDQYGLMAIKVEFDGRDGMLSMTQTDQATATPYLTELANLNGVRQLRTELMSTHELTHPISVEQIKPDDSGLYSPPHEHALEQIDLTQVRFHYAQANLTPASLPILDQLATELKRYPTLQVEISAHTDNSGTALGNLAMSSARAQQVVHYLISQGLDAKQLVAVGYGSTRPIHTNTTAQGRASNQRIALTVLKE